MARGSWDTESLRSLRTASGDLSPFSKMTTDLTSRLAAIPRELTAPQVVEVKAARYVRVALAVRLTGYSDKAIRRKMEDGVWREGDIWLRSASGEILIDMEGYEKWCKGR